MALFFFTVCEKQIQVPKTLLLLKQCLIFSEALKCHHVTKCISEDVHFYSALQNNIQDLIVMECWHILQQEIYLWQSMHLFHLTIWVLFCYKLKGTGNKGIWLLLTMECCHVSYVDFLDFWWTADLNLGRSSSVWS